MTEAKASRRDFLKLAATGAPAAAIAAVAGTAEAETPKPQPGGVYAKTEHVEKYLETARF